MDNPVNQKFSDYLFTTEGHLLPIGDKFRTKPWADSPTPISPVDEMESLFFREKTPKIKINNGTQPTVRLVYKLYHNLIDCHRLLIAT